MSRQEQGRFFLVSYDYGQGGVWGHIKARTPEDITSKYPCLEVVPEIPDWMNDSVRAVLPNWNLNDPKDPFLGKLDCPPNSSMIIPDQDFPPRLSGEHGK